MADRYWLGGNWSDSANWSATNNGSGGASVPTSADNVYWHTIPISNTYTVDGAAYYRDMDWTGATNNPTIAGTSNSGLYCYGNITFISAMIITFNRGLIICGNCLLTTNGVHLPCYISTNVGLTSLSLADDLYMTREINVSSGYFTTNNKNIFATYFKSISPASKTLNFGSSVISIGYVELYATAGLTLNAGTSTLIITGTDVIFSGAGKTFNNVEIQGTPTTITGSNTFNDLKLTAGKTVNFTAGTTQTLNTLTANGSTLQSTIASSPATISKLSGIATIADASIKDITVTGGATWKATNSTNISGNTGWLWGSSITVNLSFVVTNIEITWDVNTIIYSASIGTDQYTLNGVTKYFANEGGYVNSTGFEFWGMYPNGSVASWTASYEQPMLLGYDTTCRSSKEEEYAVSAVSVDGIESSKSTSAIATCELDSYWFTNTTTNATVELTAEVEWGQMQSERVREEYIGMDESYPSVCYGSQRFYRGNFQATLLEPTESTWPIYCKTFTDVLDVGNSILMRSPFGDLLELDVYNLKISPFIRTDIARNISFDMVEIAEMVPAGTYTYSTPTSEGYWVVDPTTNLGFQLYPEAEWDGMNIEHDRFEGVGLSSEFATINYGNKKAVRSGFSGVILTPDTGTLAEEIMRLRELIDSLNKIPVIFQTPSGDKFLVDTYGFTYELFDRSSQARKVSFEFIEVGVVT